jgi:Zn-dependent protease with chaperone function
VLYQTALFILLQLGSSVPLAARLPARAVRAVLLEWSRSAELTADRAGALSCRDPIISCRALMVLAAGLPSHRLDLDAFLQQAAETRSGTRAGIGCSASSPRARRRIRTPSAACAS